MLCYLQRVRPFVFPGRRVAAFMILNTHSADKFSNLMKENSSLFFPKLIFSSDFVDHTIKAPRTNESTEAGVQASWRTK